VLRIYSSDSDADIPFTIVIYHYFSHKRKWPKSQKVERTIDKLIDYEDERTPKVRKQLDAIFKCGAMQAEEIRHYWDSINEMIPTKEREPGQISQNQISYKGILVSSTAEHLVTLRGAKEAQKKPRTRVVHHVMRRQSQFRLLHLEKKKNYALKKHIRETMNFNLT